MIAQITSDSCRWCGLDQRVGTIDEAGGKCIDCEPGESSTAVNAPPAG